MRLMRALALAVALMLPAAAHAAPYEAFIDVESQEDLDDMFATGDISAETHGALTELLTRGVDLDRAGREELYSLPNLTYDEVDAILAYRATQRFVADPADLVAAGAISEQKLLAISAFLVLHDRSRGQYAPRGTVRTQVRAAQGDEVVPPIGVRARVTFGRNLAVGAAATLSRYGVTNVAWDANRGGFLADHAGTRPNLAKLYARYRADHVDVIAGTYRIGFDQRLTFDTSSDYTPDGIYVDDQTSSNSELGRTCRESTGELSGTPCPPNVAPLEYGTRDFSWSEGLLGMAAGSDRLELGAGYVQAYGWGSYQPRNVYQYKLRDRAACADPFACSGPPVFVRPDGDVLTPAAALSYQTLPNVLAEALVGGHLAYHAARRDYVGVTAYGATTRWLIETPDDVQLDLQDWDRRPMGGRYGAIGVSAGLGRGIYDGFLEVTRSFDRQPDAADDARDGGGGVAAIARVTRSLRHRELELSARYYDVDFDNPYAGPIAQADQVDGAAARGEHGVRARYTATHGVASIRASLDLWRHYVPVLDTYLPRAEAEAHVDVQGSDQLAYGLWLDYTDRDLRDGGYGSCFENATEPGEEAEEVACTGMRLKTTARLRFDASRALSVRGQLVHKYQDDPRYDDARRQDVGAIVTATWRKSKDLRLLGRLKYLNEDIASNQRLEQSLWATGEVRMRTRIKDALSARAELFVWLDQRASTQLRSPSPELRLNLSYVAKF